MHIMFVENFKKYNLYLKKIKNIDNNPPARPKHGFAHLISLLYYIQINSISIHK